ncbi:MAG: acyl-CoA dehydrogenase family protein [Bdellovibrio sp.]|nr:acyl-CoA dehydrogenase family protein [Bdellovibrio sp.]
MQEVPVLSNNQFTVDRLLQDYLTTQIPGEVYHAIKPDLERFGQRVMGDILRMGEDADAYPPVHIPFDAFGHRIDEIRVSKGWEEMARVSAEEGLVAIGYERKYGPYSRLYQMAKNYLFAPSSAYYSCPLAMTDGAAKLIENFGSEELKISAFTHLISRNPDHFWASGQWMTERTGGSDVGTSETRARKDGDAWRLYGVKWFTSAVTSPMAMTLARIENDKGEVVQGSKGLSLFLIKLRDDSGKYNNLEIIRLKDKLGTRALPTAELRLEGSRALLVGEIGRGVKTIATLFNVTRIHNALSAVASSRRLLNWALDYASKREAFGKTLKDHPLHMQTLSELEIEFQGAFHLFFYTVRLLGLNEAGIAEERKQAAPLLRIYTPLAKLYTAKQNLKITSEVIESFGGVGYLENSGLSKWLRDGQTLAIWEGTTNVLSLDVLRSMQKENTFPPFLKDISLRLLGLKNPELQLCGKKIMGEIDSLQKFASQTMSEGDDFMQAQARHFSYSLARVAMAALMLEFADRPDHDTEKYRISAKRMASKKLVSLLWADPLWREENNKIVFS